MWFSSSELLPNYFAKVNTGKDLHITDSGQLEYLVERGLCALPLCVVQTKTSSSLHSASFLIKRNTFVEVRPSHCMKKACWRSLRLQKFETELQSGIFWNCNLFSAVQTGKQIACKHGDDASASAPTCTHIKNNLSKALCEHEHILICTIYRHTHTRTRITHILFYIS